MAIGRNLNRKTYYMVAAVSVYYIACCNTDVCFIVSESTVVLSM